MATFVTGEYLNDVLAPQLLREYRDDKSDFLAAIPDAPAQAMTEEGLRLMILKEVTEAEIDPAGDYVDADVNQLDHDRAIIPYQYITTKPTEVNKEDLRMAIYDKRNYIREHHSRIIKRKFRDYVLDGLAPDDDTNTDLPVMRTTGEVVNGRKRMQVSDLIEYASLLRGLNIPMEGWNLRLSNEHITDLTLETKGNQDFRDHYHSRKTGELMIQLYGFDLWMGNHEVLYDASGVKKPMGSVKAATDQNSSVFWLSENVCKAWGNVMLHLKPMTQDTRGNYPKEEFRVTGNVKVTRKQEIATGAIVSDNE